MLRITGSFNLQRHDLEYFLHARLNDLAEQTAADLHFVATAQSRQQDRRVIDDLRQVGIAMLPLELLGLIVEDAKSLANVFPAIASTAE